MPVLPLQTIPGIPELLIIAMLSAMIVGAVFLGLKLIQSLREFREGYSPEPEADLSRMDLSDADLTDTTLDETVVDADADADADDDEGEPIFASKELVSEQGAIVNQSGEVMCPNSECDTDLSEHDSEVNFCPGCGTEIPSV